jgi:hypothetical protein
LTSNPVWSGLTLDLRVRKGGPVDLDEALARARRVVLDVQPHYGSGEEAMAATNFALSFADDYFFEFDVHSRAHISLHYELPGIPWHARWLRDWAGFFRGRFWNYRTLTSEGEMCRMIELFFTLPPAELDTILERER